jgi:hypothetical protein
MYIYVYHNGSILPSFQVRVGSVLFEQRRVHVHRRQSPLHCVPHRPPRITKTRGIIAHLHNASIKAMTSMAQSVVADQTLNIHT